MNTVILSALLIPLASSLIPLLAAEGGEGSGFGAWRLSVGGALNGGVKANVRSTYDYRGLSTLPGARPTWNNTTGIDLGGGAYVNPNSDYGVDGYTYNWQLPASAVQPDGSVVYESTFTDGTAGDVKNDDQYQPGISVELSRTLWADEEAGWGVDLALAVSYFFGNDIYSAHGTTTKYTTTIPGGAEADPAVDPAYAPDPVADESGRLWYGGGRESFYGFGALNYQRFASGAVVPVPSVAGAAAGGSSFSASGDYSELEMMLMVRPWYEVTDWWRVFGEAGLALSRSEFEFSYSAVGGNGRVSASEDFSEWRCYGVAGAGTMFRLGSFDLSVDFLGRFLNDDLDCNGRYSQGSVEKADWVLRVMAGFEF